MEINKIKIPEKLKYHDKRVAVTKSFDFSASHFLYKYNGKCKNLHGHTYTLILSLSGYVDDCGLLVDFNLLKEIYQETIHEKLDHGFINSVLPTMNSTVENMIVWVWEQLDETLKTLGEDRSVRLEELTLYETRTSRATLKRKWMES